MVTIESHFFFRKQTDILFFLFSSIFRFLLVFIVSLSIFLIVFLNFLGFLVFFFFRVFGCFSYLIFFSKFFFFLFFKFLVCLNLEKSILSLGYGRCSFFSREYTALYAVFCALFLRWYSLYPFSGPLWWSLHSPFSTSLSPVRNTENYPHFFY